MPIALPLRDVPDLTDWSAVTLWVESRLDALSRSSFSDHVRSTFIGLELAQPQAATVGCFSSESWRKLALAAFLADWACYPKQVDRADFVRLAYVAGTFPSGFRVWFCQLEDQQFTPVGYTGWYPISAGTLSLLLEKPETVSHRGVIAPLGKLDQHSCLYLFNASIVPQLRHGSDQSRRMMRLFAEDVSKVQKNGLLSVTVSEDGQRFSRRFGMKPQGSITIDGDVEQVFVRVQPEPWF